MTLTWIRKVWNRVRGKHQRGIQSNGRSKYPKQRTKSKESSSSPPPQAPPAKKEDDSGLYRGAAPPIVIEPVGIEEDDAKYKQAIEHQHTPLREPGGELHMIIERERSSAEHDHQNSNDGDHGHHSQQQKQ
ncbi:uncharacterized protein FA14DRAFT_177349 [Meira miltonrushii]|uniref:Uncharacterized protein n=1 Tax=Meira miltonrushii TaxID=1280837 RepID=A0A316VKF8_9BASI|nr:uncharacterized protein FA14DRAFT_177349 [Meira miltonrushii]PWN38072.1 hypothetical protein FA14DRAFT_177349 [Meira miltonrushii]